ncbi:uncharacterized protein CCOS01_00247 [Colletotrichum costaricense]|uniref:HTH CENPB-type domain-containing protein n=1 Tax=Colletotrichum costaricense TaxID=1209916 RepID=A0AAI9Z8L0_9PEZI|nr:uncharacterized protein CCOS01_00247 [Colletotrichum costaricense]KAK1538933.1 hypothetical protein CCOS01_00247 [Colletotrichum costaricense]
MGSLQEHSAESFFNLSQHHHRCQIGGNKTSKTRKKTCPRKAAKAWGIPYTTLYHRLTPGRKTCREAKQAYQRLSVSQERSLAAWAISQAELGFPVTRPQVKEFVLKVLAAHGDTHGLQEGKVAETQETGEAEAGAGIEARAAAQDGAGEGAGMMTELGETTEAGGVTGSQAEVEDESVVEAGAGTDVEAEAEVDEVDMETPAGQNNNEDMETWEP